MGFPGGSDGIESACNAGNLGSIPRLGRSPGERNGYSLIFLPGEFHGQRSLMGYNLWGNKELDMTEQFIFIYIFGASLVAQRLKRLPGMRETRVRSLGWEDPLEKEMATHSSTLAWRIPWREEPGRLQSMGSQRVGHDWATSLSLSHICLGCAHLACKILVPQPGIEPKPPQCKCQVLTTRLPGNSQLLSWFYICRKRSRVSRKFAQAWQQEKVQTKTQIHIYIKSKSALFRLLHVFVFLPLIT